MRGGVARIGALSLAILLSCSPATSDKKSVQEKSESLLFLRGATLTRLDLATGKSARVGTFPTTDVHAAPVEPYVAYVVGSGPPGATEDFVRDPELRVLDLDSRAEDNAGAGVAPMWNPTGTLVAYLRPTAERGCEAEACSGLRQVLTFDPGTGRTEVLSAPGHWTLLGWTGDRVLAADRSALDGTASLGSGRPRRLPIAPSEVWGGSPDGHWLLATGPTGTRFLELGPGGSPTGEEVEITLPGRLADGAWASDSSRVAVVLLGRAGVRRAVVFGPDAPKPRTIPGSEVASGQLLWLGDNRVVISGVAPGGRLTTSLCPLDGKGCRELFSWGRGVVLLRTEDDGPPRAE